MQKQRIIAKICQTINSKKWDCLINNCNSAAINSHLLQQNGILNHIAENGHLIEVKISDANNWNENVSPIEFKKIGISKAISLKVFCSKHDTNLFKDIEMINASFGTYKSFLLFSYRALCAEIRKKHTTIETFKKLLTATSLVGKINAEYAQTFIYGSEMGINELNKLKQIFESEIETNTDAFTFKTYRYNKIDVYASALFSPFKHEIANPNDFEQLENVFIHIIPNENEILIITGYHNSFTSDWIINFVNSWGNLNEIELEEKLTDLFAVRIENWGMSPKLFSEIKLENKLKYIAYTKNNALNLQENQKIDFNIFEK